ncbi:MAG TPA: vitamin B12 dependent-methionine synthase activation domain-containing protein [bacterium]|nr:vitamin B12 dependent-methionine synthase activation domain-containing protein [bacterium]
MDNITLTCKDGLFSLNNIPFCVDAGAISDKLRIPRDGEDFRSLREMASDAEKTGIPKAIYRVSFPCDRTEDTVTVEGVRLKSRVLSVNLEKAYRIFLYIVTCGEELEQWSTNYKDPLFAYFADQIKEAALSSAIKFLYSHVKEKYVITGFSRMAPGSLKDWPIEEQKPFFEIMGNVKETAGVVLTESFLMRPSKSVSGILFPTESTFESCMLCPREKCIGRKAPYDENLFAERYKT